jgi:hypothetical protein
MSELKAAYTLMGSRSVKGKLVMTLPPKNVLLS